MNEIKKYFVDNTNALPLELYKQLYNLYDETILNFVYYAHFKILPPTKTIDELKVSKTKRSKQDIFRDDLIKKYKTCVITGDDADICEACHIIPYSESNDNEKYDINNGLLLSASIHKLFDSSDLSINNDGCVVLSDKITNKSTYKKYWPLDNMKVNIDKQTMNNLKVHYTKFNTIN